ncbi:MAG: hypothetical protein P1V51_17770 [Deltaproteobacteria bacterium]|nr:hypothetical protein [Deltaproteobacteria bacterium]
MKTPIAALGLSALLSGEVQIELSLKGDPSSLVVRSPAGGLPLTLQTERYGPSHIRVRITRAPGDVPAGSTTLGTLEIDAGTWSGFHVSGAKVIEGEAQTPVELQLVPPGELE